MLIVALTELKGDLETEAPKVAGLLRLSPYDVKSRLGGPLPKVLAHADDSTAQEIHQGLRAMGHGTLLYDPAAVVSTLQMVSLHRFTFDQAGLWANDAAGERLAWADVGVVVVALLRSPVTRTTEEVEVQSSIKRNAPSTVRHAVARTEHVSTHSAYLFPHSRAMSRRPWLFDEATAQFMSLGPKMQATRRANFFTTVNLFRRLIPNAVVDDRFVTGPLIAPTVLHARGYDGAPPVVGWGQADVTINILASWLMRDHAGPYRG